MFNEKSKKIDRQFAVIFSVVAILFLIMGVAKGVFDLEYLVSAQYLLTSLILVILVKQISNKKLTFNNRKNKYTIFLNLGFVFSIVGLSLNIGLWGLGIIFLLVGLSKK